MIRIEFDELLGDDRRQFFRIKPSPDNPILLKTESGTFALLEVSGGGCRLPIDAHSAVVASGEQYLFFPGCDEKLKISLRVVIVDEESFGAEFVDLESKAQEMICNYVRSCELELVRYYYREKSAAD